MSKKKANKRPREESKELITRLSGKNVSENANDKHLEVIINKTTNEIVFKDSKSNEAITVSATITEIEEEEEEEIEPLSLEAFRTALERIKALGLVWTGDRLPGLRPKEGVPDDVLFSDEMDKIQEDYPYLPREVGALVFHIMSGKELPEEIIGSKDDVEKKAQIVRESILDINYRSEFFFKNAIKVPYLVDIDWEVVFKLSEKSIQDIPGISYALLSLEFHNPSVDIKSANRYETFTVAVNRHLVNNLIATLTDLQSQLETGQKAAEAVSKLLRLGDESHENSDSKQLGQRESSQD